MIIEQLSSLPDDTAALEPWTLTDPEVRELTRAVSRARSALDEIATRLAAAADDRGLARQDGCTSTTAWLAKTTGLARGEAARLVSLSRKITGQVDATRSAWSHGLITTDQAKVIAEAITALPGWFGPVERGDAEQVMLDHADDLTLEDLKRLGNHIVQVIDPDGADEIIGKQLEEQEKRALAGTHISLFDQGDGTTKIKGLLPTAQAGMLRTALEALASPRRGRDLTETWGPHGDAALDHPNHAQRMGWALCELIEHLPADKLPQAGGLPATVTIDIDLTDLKAAIGAATLSSGGQISATQTGRLVCNAFLIPVVMDDNSTILDMNQARRLHDRYQRIALAKRDGGCCWKGCDRPPAWCEAHHLTPYSQGGPTTIDNGALFCFTHHHLLHDQDWQARLADDNIVEVIPPERIDPHRRPLRHARHTQLQPRAA